MSQPSRSLVQVDVSTEREDGIPTLHCLCDCGTLTHIDLEVTFTIAGTMGMQFAYTCDSCQTSHWLTFTALAQTPHAPATINAEPLSGPGEAEGIPDARRGHRAHRGRERHHGGQG